MKTNIFTVLDNPSDFLIALGVIAIVIILFIIARKHLMTDSEQYEAFYKEIQEKIHDCKNLNKLTFSIIQKDITRLSKLPYKNSEKTEVLENELKRKFHPEDDYFLPDLQADRYYNRFERVTEADNVFMTEGTNERFK